MNSEEKADDQSESDYSRYISTYSKDLKNKHRVISLEQQLSRTGCKTLTMNKLLLSIKLYHS